jgi:hypothetical protein
MKTRKLASALFILLASSTASFAQATADEAAKIQASMQAYFGSEPGVVTVTPAGEGYDITLDPAPYIKKMNVPDLTANVVGLKINAVSKGENLWAVSSNAPLSMDINIPKIFSLKLGTGAMQWTGTYDSNLLAFLDSQAKITDMNFTQSQVDPSTGMITTSETKVAEATATTNFKDMGNGAVDGTMQMTYTGWAGLTKIESPAADGGAPTPALSFTTNFNKLNYDSTATGQIARPVAELLAYFVALPNPEAIKQDQAKLKEKLLAALPLFSSITGKMTIEGMTIGTPLGNFTADGGGLNVAMNGVTKDGRLMEEFEVSGFKMPDTLPLPPWTKGLVPTKMKIGFDVSDFDADAPVRKFITEMDLNQPDPVPPGSEAAYLAAVAPKSTIKLGLPAGEITSELYSLTYEGSSDISVVGGMPSVKAKFAMKGMDAVIAQLQQAGADPMAQQGMAMLFAAKGMGKAEGDTTIWDIDFNGAKLMINGTDMTSMMGALGGQPPAQ